MLRKNNSQKRFNTAGARIPFSRKLPQDFFSPSIHSQTLETSHFVPLSKKEIQGPSNFRGILCNKDPQQFTFRRSSSENHCSLHERTSPRRYLCPNNEKQNSKQTMKLPPIINFTLLRQKNQPAKKLINKLTKKGNQRISHDFRHFRQKQNVEL